MCWASGIGGPLAGFEVAIGGYFHVKFPTNFLNAVAFPTAQYSDNSSDQVIVATGTELAPYATNGSGKTSPLVMTSFIDLSSAGNETRDSKQKSHLQQRQK
jgi:hypothetical protein